MPQQSMSDFVKELENIGQLIRITEEKRVDELASIMEGTPDKAVFVEKIKDCEFQFLSNAYSNREQYAYALGCGTKELGQKIAALSGIRHKPVIVDTAPFKEVILKGDDIDLTKFPLFLYHDYDGHAFIQDTNVVSRDPDTGLINWGIYRFMYRTKNETNVDMRNDSHNARKHARKYADKGIDMPAAVVIGGPTLDKIASMYSFSETDDWDILGGFYGTAARVVKCETSDLTVPANAEIVIEGRIMTSEGWVYDEGPYGEYTGTYGGGLPLNNRFKVDCITYRRGGIYQYATIGGLHPGRTDLYIFHPTVEADIYDALKRAGINVLDVFVPADGVHNIAYARIKTVGGGDAKQALGIMLTCSRQWFPKIAYVFDDDIDIFDETRIKWAIASRFDPQKDTIILPEQNVLPLDPICMTNKPPVYMSKIGFDCTIPVVGDVDRFSFAACTVTEPLGEPPVGLKIMTEDELTKDMTEFIKKAPRSWHEIIKYYHGQPYPNIYRAFGALRHKLGRVADERPTYPYTFSDSCLTHKKA